MPDVRRETDLGGATADEVLQAGLRALAAAGFDIWKTRPLAWFAIARRREGNTVLEANLSVRGGKEARLSVGLRGEDVSEALLADVATELLQRTTEQLGRRTA